MATEDLVREHYSGDDLEGRVLQALRSAGIDPDRLAVDDLSGVDQLHAGFGPAAAHLLEMLQLSPGTTLLDVGSGIGGPARMAAALCGARVTGIDLSAGFVALNRALNRRVGLDGAITVDQGSATALPYGDASFARAMINHVGMNIPDKAAVFREVRRVLEPGGLFGVYEQMRIGDGELVYPMPWAEDETSSFVERRARYAEMLVDAGFEIVLDEDRTAANAAAGPPPPGALTPAALFGDGFGERIGNNITAAMEGNLGAILMIARAA